MYVLCQLYVCLSSGTHANSIRNCIVLSMYDTRLYINVTISTFILNALLRLLRKLRRAIAYLQNTVGNAVKGNDGHLEQTR